MHDDIEKFTLDGEVADNNLVEHKERLIMSLETVIRDKGFVPVLDIDPQFSLDYIPQESKYNFKLTIYGVEVKENAWQIAGLMNGKVITRYIPKPR